MRKYYLEEKQDDKEFWKKRWEKEGMHKADLDNPLLRYNNIIPVSDNFFSKDGRVLEAGCGACGYLAHYKKKGFDIIGVDFDEETLRRIKKRYPQFPLVVADVRSLPFKDGVFESCFYGGVIEHLEEGPTDVLNEARRVMSRTASLVLTVPYIGLKQRIENFIFRDKKDYKVAHSFNNSSNRNFYSYSFTFKEIQKILKWAGFDPVFNDPVSIEYGLRDFALVRRIASRLKKSRDKKEYKALKEIFVKEDRSKKLSRPLLFLLKRIFATSIIFVCRKKCAE